MQQSPEIRQVAILKPSVLFLKSSTKSDRISFISSICKLIQGYVMTYGSTIKNLEKPSPFNKKLSPRFASAQPLPLLMLHQEPLHRARQPGPEWDDRRRRRHNA